MELTMIEWVQLAAPLVSGLAGSLITFRLMNNKMKADANKANAEASSVLVGASIEMVDKLKELVDDHAEQIEKLEERVKELQKQEILHNEERSALSKKIEELKRENLRLRTLDDNKSGRIISLEKKITKLQNQLKKYADTN